MGDKGCFWCSPRLSYVCVANACGRIRTDISPFEAVTILERPANGRRTDDGIGVLPLDDACIQSDCQDLHLDLRAPEARAPLLSFSQRKEAVP
jgi:hypothetical protein